MFFFPSNLTESITRFIKASDLGTGYLATDDELTECFMRKYDDTIDIFWFNLRMIQYMSYLNDEKS